MKSSNSKTVGKMFATRKMEEMMLLTAVPIQLWVLMEEAYKSVRVVLC